MLYDAIANTLKLVSGYDYMSVETFVTYVSDRDPSIP